MDKEEILAKSRSENKGADVFEREVLKDAGNFSTLAAVLLAAVFYLVGMLAGKRMNYGLWAIVFSVQAATFTVKAVRLKRKHEMLFAALYILATLLFAAAHIGTLLEAW